jgi:hypothetical protein
MQHARGKREALLPSAGQRAGELVLARGQAEAVERPVHRGAPVRHLVDARGEVEVLADGEVFPEREALRHVADVALDRFRLRADVVAEAGAAAGVRSEQAAHEADRGRLAAAVGPEEAEDLALLDAHRKIDHDFLGAEALVQVVDVDDSRALAHFSVTLTGCPGCNFAAFSADGRASIMNTSLSRVSLL